jgi:RNA polymerase sigma-70 factor, ECF subfamily
MSKNEIDKRCPDFAAILRETEPSESLIAQIAECFSTEMQQMATRRCRDESLAEEARQDALLAAIRALPDFRGDGSLEGWLYRLVTSACSRTRRGRKNDPKYNLPLDEETAGQDSLQPPDQEMVVLLRERLGFLQDSLEAVPEPNRTLLLLHEGEDVPLADLAERFDLSLDSVKSRLKRTRALVRENLLKAAGEPSG